MAAGKTRRGTESYLARSGLEVDGREAEECVRSLHYSSLSNIVLNGPSAFRNPYYYAAQRELNRRLGLIMETADEKKPDPRKRFRLVTM